jgi:hypothetical protein
MRFFFFKQLFFNKYIIITAIFEHYTCINIGGPKRFSTKLVVRTTKKMGTAVQKHSAATGATNSAGLYFM